MLLSIVIPAFNEEKELPACLASVRTALAACGLESECEIIVCDNNSTDRTAAVAAEGGARVVPEPVNQISRARNAGAAHASGRWLLFIDADSRLATVNLDAVSTLARAGGPVAAGGCTIEIEGTPWWAGLSVAGWNCYSRLAGVAAGSFVFCDTSLFRRIGGFSLEYYAAEELDFSTRIKLAAAEEGRSFRVLHAEPHVSSGRKFRKYSLLQLLVQMRKVLLGFRRLVGSPRELDYFYDGIR